MKKDCFCQLVSWAGMLVTLRGLGCRRCHCGAATDVVGLVVVVVVAVVVVVVVVVVGIVVD